MTEAEWLSGTSPGPMLESLRGRRGGRKRRLLAVACCRRILDWMPEGCRSAVEVAERYADGRAVDDERQAAFEAAGRAHDRAYDNRMRWAGYCAQHANQGASWFERPTAWHEDAAAWVAQVAAQPLASTEPHGAPSGPSWEDTTLRSEHAAIADLIRDIFGNPFRPLPFDPTWLTSAVVALARSIYDGPAFDGMPILGDALEGAGCVVEEILDHCRSRGPHVRGCWVVDAILGKS